MSVDKLVDSTQLDADLTSVANAIRAKGGTSAALAFPADFVSAIGDIPSGGSGYTADQIANPANNTGKLIITETSVARGAFSGWSGITSIEANNLTTAENESFYGMTGLASMYFPQMTEFNGRPFGNVTAIMVFPKLTSLESRRLESWKGTTIDFGSLSGGLKSTSLYGCDNTNLIILRRTSIVPLQNANAFNSTKFASGSTGGTIYIPKSLYDHLGDGTSSDYKAATNWSTLNGYGTITWAKIEGSIYENAYADGTPIPT